MNMTEKLRYIIFILLCVPLFVLGQNLTDIPRLEKQVAAHPDDEKALKKLVSLCLNKADYDKAILYGKRLLATIGPSTSQKAERMKAHVCASLGQAYTVKGNEKEAWNYLRTALNTGLREKDDTILCVVYNGLGLFATNIRQDYYQALAYYFKGIDSAKRIHQDNMYTILLSNIVGIYYLQKDVTGLKYAQEVYDLGHRKNEPFLTFMGATTLAAMYSLKGDYVKGFDYIHETEQLMNRYGFKDQGSVYNIYGYLWLKKNDLRKAAAYFNKALSYAAQSQVSSVVDAYRGLAEVHAGSGDYTAAINVLHKALDLSYKENNGLFRGDMLNRLSAFYEKTGDLKHALEYYKLYNRENNRLFDAARERAVNEMRAKYDVVRQESELRKNRLELLEKDRNLQLTLAGLVFIGFLSGLMFYLFRKKNKLYRVIVKQHQAAIREEEQLRENLKELEERLQASTQQTEPRKYSSSSLSEERKRELFRQLEHLFRDESLYKDNMLTKKKVADLLNSNQTYLSQIINEQTGQTFTQYINGYRIKEAVRLLSDAGCDTPLKAISADLGFNSMTTFYNLFRSEIGMTPAQYRKSVVDTVVN